MIKGNIMKQILISFIILFPLVTYTMENPTISDPTTIPTSSGVSADRFIDYMNTACASADRHSKVQFCTYTLLWATYEGNDQIFDAALNYWNHWKNKSIEDFTRTELACPFVTAASKGYWYGAQKLLERSKGVIINDGCQVPIHVAGVPQNSNVICCIGKQYSALAAAAKNGHSHLIANLLEYFSDTPLDVDRVGKNKKTALMEAIAHDKLACTRALLQGKLKKSNPNAPLADKSFGSVLHWALSFPELIQHVKALIENGADINLIRKEKEYQQEGTPLMIAVAYANEEGVRLLLEAKARVELKHPLSNLAAKELAQMRCEIVPSQARQNILRMLTQAESDSCVTPGAP